MNKTQQSAYHNILQGFQNMDDFISYQTYSKFPLLYENTVSEAAETRISILRFSIVNVNDSYNYAPHRHTGPELMFSVRGSYDCTLNDREFPFLRDMESSFSRAISTVTTAERKADLSL